MTDAERPAKMQEQASRIAGDAGLPDLAPVQPEVGPPPPNGDSPPGRTGEDDELGELAEMTVGPADDGARLAQLAAEIAEIRALLTERLRYDATKEEAFRRLYEDLERFRGEASFVQTRPLYLDLVLMLDRLHWSIEPWRERSQEVADFLMSLEDEVEELLTRQGVQRLPVSGGVFDPSHHRAVRIEQTQDPAEHNSIASVVRRGYEWNGRLLRAEEVVVWRLAAPERPGE